MAKKPRKTDEITDEDQPVPPSETRGARNRAEADSGDSLEQPLPPSEESRSFGAEVLAEMHRTPRRFFEAQAELENHLGLADLIQEPRSFAIAEQPGQVDLTNIRGISIGNKQENGIPRPQLCIVVHVRSKVWESDIVEGEIPREIGGIPTDVVEAPSAVAYNFTVRERPVRGGCSIRPRSSQYQGTLGCVVRRGNKGLILSNNHVLAEENRFGAGEPIVQPGNGTFPADWIGYLEEVVPLRPGVWNMVDAALAHADVVTPSNPDGRVSPDHHYYRIDPNPIPAYVGMPVKKEGQRTGATMGEVKYINALRMQIAYNRLGPLSFRRVVIIESNSGRFFSQQGDSGSLIVERHSNRPTALLFAGGGIETYANPIEEVMSALGNFSFV